MKRILAGLAGALIAVSSPAMAQDAAGYWQGSLALNAQTSIRVGVMVERGDSGALTGTLDSPDQNAFDIPIADIANEDGSFSFRVPAIQGAYEANWDEADQAWDGIFVQLGQSFPLVLTAGNPAERPEPVALPAEWSIPDNDALRAILEDRISGRPGEGIVMGVAEQGGTRITAAGPNGGQAFDADTVFEIGSMTKVFTALLLADMVIAGEVALDDPVEMHLPEGATMPARHGKQITLRHLTMQNSGLPRLPDNMPYGDPQDPYADYTPELLLEFLTGYELTRDPGAEYEYSNLGVGLLGYALAQAADTDYETLLRERILDPLAMDDTAIELSPDQLSRFAQGHDQFMRPTSPWEIPVISGAGALRSTAADMLKFLGATLDPDSPIGAAMELTLSDRLDAVGTENQTALGWIIIKAPSGEVLGHGGGTGGFLTFMGVQPEQDRGVVVLTNAAVEPSGQDIALHALTGSPVANEVPVPPAPPPVPQREEVTLSTEQLDHVTGTYRMAPGLEMIVRREGDRLMAQLTGQPAFPIFAEAPLTFFWKIVNAQVTFTEEGGVVTGGNFVQDGREITVNKVE